MLLHQERRERRKSKYPIFLAHAAILLKRSCMTVFVGFRRLVGVIFALWR